MRFAKLGLMLVAGLFLTGCVFGISPAVNTSNVQEVDFSSNFKKGEACMTRILFFPPTGEASIVAAAKNAGISKVEVVDYRVDFFFFSSRKCTVVYGN